MNISTRFFFTVSLFCCLLIFLNTGCGGSGGGSQTLDGDWDVTVRLSSNSCANDVPIVESLTYVHTIREESFDEPPQIVTLVDENGDNFDSGNTATADSFIATGTNHSLAPFISGAECQETIVWGYFDIFDNSSTDNVSRSSIIECTAPSGNTTCGVNYVGEAQKR